MGQVFSGLAPDFLAGHFRREGRRNRSTPPPWVGFDLHRRIGGKSALHLRAGGLFRQLWPIPLPGRLPGQRLRGFRAVSASQGIELGDFSDHDAYLLAWQLGAYVSRGLPTCGAKVAPCDSTRTWDMATPSDGFYGPFVGQEWVVYTFASGQQHQRNSGRDRRDERTDRHHHQL